MPQRASCDCVTCRKGGQLTQPVVPFVPFPMLGVLGPRQPKAFRVFRPPCRSAKYMPCRGIHPSQHFSWSLNALHHNRDLSEILCRGRPTPPSLAGGAT